MVHRQKVILNSINNDTKQPKSNSIRLNCPSKHPTSNGKQPEMRVNSLEVKQISQSQEKKKNISDKKIDDYSLHHLFPQLLPHCYWQSWILCGRTVSMTLYQQLFPSQEIQGEHSVCVP